MEPRPQDPRNARDTVAPIRFAMENHSNGPQGYLRMVEKIPANLSIARPLWFASELLRMGDDTTNLKRCFYNGALFGISIAKNLLTEEEIKRVPEAIRNIVADCFEGAKNNTRELQSRSDNLIGISNLGLQEYEDYALEIEMIKDKLSTVNTPDGETYSLLGASFMLHVIHDVKRQSEIDRKVAEGSRFLDVHLELLGIVDPISDPEQD